MYMFGPRNLFKRHLWPSLREMKHFLFRLCFFMILSSWRLHFPSSQSPTSPPPQKRAFPDKALKWLLVVSVMHNSYLGMLHQTLPSAESNESFQALRVSTKAKAPLTLISVSLLFCFLVVSFSVCHSVALPWFMSCLCFVSVSIPLHLKCPALPRFFPWSIL